MPNRKRVIPLTNEQWNDLYVTKGISAKELATRFETTPVIIRRHLSEAGLKIRGRGGRNEAHAFLHRCEELIREMLDAGVRCTKIARQLKCSASAIQLKAGRMGYRLKAGMVAAPVDHTFFGRIDSEAKAYWLGFMMADGSAIPLRNGSWTVALNLAIRDKAHVAAFKTVIRSGHIIHRNWLRYPSVRLAFRSDPMGKLLKAAKLETGLPSMVPPVLLSHWLRGYFDGDGHIQTRPVPALILVGPRKRMIAIRDYLRKHVGVRSGNVTKSSNTIAVDRLTHYRREDVSKVLEYLYANCTTALPRKLATANSVLRPT